MCPKHRKHHGIDSDLTRMNENILCHGPGGCDFSQLFRSLIWKFLPYFVQLCHFMVNEDDIFKLPRLTCQWQWEGKQRPEKTVVLTLFRVVDYATGFLSMYILLFHLVFGNQSLYILFFLFAFRANAKKCFTDQSSINRIELLDVNLNFPY